MEVILAIIAIVVIVYLLVYVVAPIAGILATAALVIGMVYALIVSSISFFTSLSKHINPYTTYIDKERGLNYGVRRNYFFGPGYHQINITVKEAFENQKEYFDKVHTWVKSFRNNHYGQWYLNVWVDLFFISACICIYIFGMAWVIAFSFLLFSVIFFCMCLFYIFFSLLWVMDRFTLIVHSIQSRCPNCKRISIVPIFCCPKCGFEHKNLTPGPYGVLHRRCSCGNRIPTTVLNGRSKLEAKCPFCQSELAASDATQFGIQLVGGVSSGKTTFLSAFWHNYVKKLNENPDCSYKLFPEDDFNELEYWFNEGISSSTNEMNAKMYSVVYKLNGSTPFQMTLYDVAGESFTNLDSDIQQQQFKYCEGLIIIVDSTERPEISIDSISGFINELRRLKGISSTKMNEMPVAILISKSDLFKKDIGLPKIRTMYNLSKNENNDITFDSFRSKFCRDFLVNKGFETLVNLLDSEFNNMEFFPVSAIGHEAKQGEKYSPWGVIEPVEWILNKNNINRGE